MYGQATITPAANAALLLDDKLRTHLNLAPHAEIDDYVREVIIPAATEIVQADIEAQLITATLKVTRDEFPTATSGRGRLLLPKPPLQSVTSVNYIDADGNEQTMSADDYHVDVTTTPGHIQPTTSKTWPATANQPGAVWVIYVAGYGDTHASIPMDIKHVLYAVAKQLYERRDDAAPLDRSHPLMQRVSTGGEFAFYG